MQQDFPFYIRIPESLPPTIALEKGGRFRLTISPHSVAHCNYSRYQVRVDCYGLYQRQKVRSFRLNSQSHVHLAFLEDSSDATNPPSFRPPLKSSLTNTNFIRRGLSTPSQRPVTLFRMASPSPFNVAKRATAPVIGYQSTRPSKPITSTLSSCAGLSLPSVNLPYSVPDQVLEAGRVPLKSKRPPSLNKKYPST